MADSESVSCRLLSTALQPGEKTAAVSSVRHLEHELFDDSGQLRRGITRARANETVASVNHLRRALGWLEIDLDGRWRWPARADQGDIAA